MPHLSHLKKNVGIILNDNIDYKNGISSCIAGLWTVGFLCTLAKNPDRYKL